MMVSTLQINLKIIEKTNENLDESLNLIRKRVYENTGSINIEEIEKNQLVSQEIVENIFQKTLNKLHENEKTLHSHESKFKIQNPWASKALNYLEDEPRKKVLFWPEASHKDYIFYGTKNLYVFMRFFYSLYEQLLMALRLSEKFEGTINGENLDLQVII